MPLRIANSGFYGDQQQSCWSSAGLMKSTKMYFVFIAATTFSLILKVKIRIINTLWCMDIQRSKDAGIDRYIALLMDSYGTNWSMIHAEKWEIST